MAKRGIFVTFEGVDYSGKSLQARRLHQRLVRDGVRVTLLRDPGATRISERIREILLNTDHAEMSPWTELLLYEAARAQMVHEVIRPSLEKGAIVLCDRFYDSTTAYQGYGRGLDLARVEQANRIGSGGLTPDLTFWIRLDPRIAAERKGHGEKDRMEGEGLEFQFRVHKGYEMIARQEPERIVTIDGDRSIEIIEREIWDIFDNYMKEHSSLET